jgi:hypothetical protein
MNTQEGREQRQLGGHNYAPLDKIMISPFVSKVSSMSNIQMPQTRPDIPSLPM